MDNKRLATPKSVTTNSRLRVGVIVPGFPEADESWFLPPVSETQAALQVYADVSVFALSYPPQNATYEWRGVRVRSVGAWKRGTWLPATLAALKLAHHHRPFDVLHAYWATEPGLVGALAKHTLGLPLVISSLGGELVALPHVRYGAQRQWRWRQLVPWILRHADCVLFGSTTQRELAKKIRGPSAARGVLLPLGAQLETPPRDRNLTTQLRLLAVSALQPVKNLGIILEALAHLPPVMTLDIVGDGPQRPHLEKQAQHLGVAERVAFHGWRAHPELSGLYAAAEVFVHAAWHEGEGVVIEEALAAGLPVVSSRVGIAGDVVVAGVNGFLFAPDDLAALISALRHFIQNPEEVRRFSAAGRAIAEEKLDRSRQVEKLGRLYKRVVSNHAKGDSLPDDYTLA